MAVYLCASVNSTSTNPIQGGKCKYAGQSVRSLPIRILSVGKKRSRGVQLMVDEYVEKLKYYCNVEDGQIRSNPRNARDIRAQVDDEDMAVMNLIRSDDWVVMLDERGQDIGSEQMADLVRDAGNTGASRLSFCIGGPYGHGRKLRERANLSIKLSSLVVDYSKRTKIPSLATLTHYANHVIEIICIFLNFKFWGKMGEEILRYE